ncbi:MAG TPA: DUF1700 domain-containing protein [Erysipelothrix sp.]|nr:DUF1700 domain-containing protein [Erysipelothrix sp.]
MTKKDYLRKLRRSIKDLPDHIIQDILRDYEEHFDDGRRQGLSEEEISRGLGDPKEVASEYLKMYPHAKKQKKESKVWDFLWFVFVVIGGLWVLVNFVPFIFELTGSIIGGLLGFIFFMVSLILVVVLIAIIYGLVKGKQVFNFVVGDRKFTFKTSDEDRNQRVYESQTIQQPVSDIAVESHLSAVIIQQEDRNDILVELDGYSSIRRSPLQVEVSNGHLSIIDEVVSQTIVNGNLNSNLKLWVRVPQKDFNLTVKSSIGSVKINGNFNSCTVDANLGSLKIDGHQNVSEVKCDMGSIRVYNNFGSANFTASMGSIKWYQANNNPHRFVVQKTMGSFKNNSQKIFNQHNNTYQSQDGMEPEVKIRSKMGSIRLEG